MELAKAGIPVKGISITSEELENYFLRLTGGDHQYLPVFPLPAVAPTLY